MNDKKTSEQVMREALEDIIFFSQGCYPSEYFADIAKKALQESEQPKLSIPKKIAEQADKTDFDELFQWGQEEFYQWFDHEHDEYKEVIYAYLAGKILGVELVSIEED